MTDKDILNLYGFLFFISFLFRIFILMNNYVIKLNIFPREAFSSYFLTPLPHFVAGFISEHYLRKNLYDGEKETQPYEDLFSVHI